MAGPRQSPPPPELDDDDDDADTDEVDDPDAWKDTTARINLALDGIKNAQQGFQNEARQAAKKVQATLKRLDSSIPPPPPPPTFPPRKPTT